MGVPPPFEERRTRPRLRRVVHGHAACTDGSIVMWFATNTAALVAGLTSLLPRESLRRPSRRLVSGVALRRTRRAPRWTSTVLTLGLGLGGIVVCPCAPNPAKAYQPQGCHHSVGHGPATTGASVQESSAACCASPNAALGVVARIDERDGLRHALTVAAAPCLSAANGVGATMPASFASLLHSPTSPRSTVLRI